MENKTQIEIPKYVLDGNQNIPEDLKKVLDYFRDCGNKNYILCLVADKKLLAKDLKNRIYMDFYSLKKVKYGGKYPFIHLDNNSLNKKYPFLPVSVKNSIRRINKLVSNPDNEFNKKDLGGHTLGLVQFSERFELYHAGYGISEWNSITVYNFGMLPKNVMNALNVLKSYASEKNMVLCLKGIKETIKNDIVGYYKNGDNIDKFVKIKKNAPKTVLDAVKIINELKLEYPVSGSLMLHIVALVSSKDAKILSNAGYGIPVLSGNIISFAGKYNSDTRCFYDASVGCKVQGCDSKRSNGQEFLNGGCGASGCDKSSCIQVDTPIYTRRGKGSSSSNTPSCISVPYTFCNCLTKRYQKPGKPWWQTKPYNTKEECKNGKDGKESET